MMEEEQIQYQEINLDKFPFKRQDMVDMTGRVTVPQVFLGNVPLGGYQELKMIKHRGGLQAYMQGHAVEELLDSRLQVPDTIREAVLDLSEVKVPHPSELTEILGTQWTDWQLRQIVVELAEIKDRGCCFNVHRNSFEGTQLLVALQSRLSLQEQQSVILAQYLQSRYIISPSTPPFVPQALYQLQRHLDPWVINNYKTLTRDYSVADPLGLLNKLTVFFAQIKSHYVADDLLTDYVGIGSDQEWPSFMEKLSELQSVDVGAMGPQERTAFLINVYNLCISVAFVVIPRPTSFYQKFRYYDNAKLILAHSSFSFNDIENGLLRNNRKAPYHLMRQFSSGDPRLGLSLCSPDNRIHFALNCGAKSCPVVNRYTKEHLHQELALSAQAFCEDNHNVLIHHNKATLSQIFKWYRQDFGSSDKEVLLSIQGFIKDTHKVDLIQKLVSGSFTITYFPYDWSTDEKPP